MDALEVFISIILNIIPLLILIIPYFFIRKKLIGKVYLRIYLGILIFYVLYWILPVIFQIGEEPRELSLQTGEEGNTLLGIGYIFTHFGSLLTLFASYPLVTLPFIFFVAPFISILLTWNSLRKDEGSVKDNLNLITYQIKTSPNRKIRDDLARNDWTREKQILKLMVVLLPISLYLLQVILEISSDFLGTESVSLTSSLGWFLEILFVYLATFIFSIELLFSSQISLKGRYFGEKIREQTYKSLYTVGVPISILSIILFMIQYRNQLDTLLVIFYFFAYFIMASIIFVLFLKIFEPFSILIFVKIIDWWKKKDLKRKSKLSNSSYLIFFALLSIGLYFIIFQAISIFIYGNFLSDPNILNQGNFEATNPTLSNAILFEILIILGFINILISILIIGLILARTLKYVKNLRMGYIIFIPFIIVISFFVIGTEEYWLTGQLSYTTVFGFEFYTLRTAGIDASLVGLLQILSYPYLYTRAIFNIIFWSLIFFYIKKDFKSKNIPIDEKFIEKTLFSTIGDLFSYEDYVEGGSSYLISKKENIPENDVEKEREEIKTLLISLENDKLLQEIKPQDENEKKRFYFTLKYLYFKNLVDIWKPELSYIYEKVEKQGLYIIYDDGRGVFNYAFRSEDVQDPGLVSGMFSAITSFIKEMTKSTETLKKIDHGDITILLEYGNKIFGALFIKGTQSSEVRAPLKEFVQKFEDKYKDLLKDWTGALHHFVEEENTKLVEDIFKED